MYPFGISYMLLTPNQYSLTRYAENTYIEIKVIL